MLFSFNTSWGDIEARLEGGCVVACTLPPVNENMSKPFSWRVPRVTGRSADARCARALSRYLVALFSGQDAPLPPCIFPRGPLFHQAVWKALLGIPYGTVTTYGALAADLGHPRAARAVGQACGANPLPLLIPCHRVVAQNHLGGFSPGPAWKQLLLNTETP